MFIRLLNEPHGEHGGEFNYIPSVFLPFAKCQFPWKDGYTLGLCLLDYAMEKGITCIFLHGAEPGKMM
jgi:hypothetical protein